MEAASSYLLTPRELAAWRGMLETHRRLIAQLDSELEREHDLPLSAYEVLMYLGDEEGGRMRMSELADHLLLSRSGITRLADRLEGRGLIERERCTDDGRGFFAQLTPTGRQKLERARPSHLAAVRRVFHARLDPAEIDTLASVWGRLLVQADDGDLDEAI